MYYDIMAPATSIIFYKKALSAPILYNCYYLCPSFGCNYDHIKHAAILHLP